MFTFPFCINRSITASLALASLFAVGIGADDAPPASASPAPSLEETRLVMGKWIETQQVIAKERNDWSQGKGVLEDRIALVVGEVTTLEERVTQQTALLAGALARKAEVVAENDRLKALQSRLADSIAGMEVQVRTILKQLPDPVQTRLQPLVARMPIDGAKATTSAAERFQNVLGILNEVNRSNGEIAVQYEVRTLADGSKAEVQAVYVGLAQGYFVSPKGEAGIGRPSLDGWIWSPAPASANDILTTLEILQGKHTPAFVPLPVNMQ